VGYFAPKQPTALEPGFVATQESFIDGFRMWVEAYSDQGGPC
jgi:hypothetical protein